MMYILNRFVQYSRYSRHLALRYQVIAKIDNQVQYIQCKDIIDTFRFMFITRYPYSHQYKRVIVIVYWSEYSDEVIQERRFLVMWVLGNRKWIGCSGEYFEK